MSSKRIKIFKKASNAIQSLKKSLAFSIKSFAAIVTMASPPLRRRHARSLKKVIIGK
jgi:hypothetical protein